MQQHPYVQFDPPEGFTLDEFQTVFVGDVDTALSDPRIAIRDQARTGRDSADVGVRENLVVRRAVAEAGAELGALASDLVARSLHNLGTDLKALESEVVTFADGAPGVLTHFTFPARKFTLAQYHCFRIDDGIVTQITLTLDANRKARPVHPDIVTMLTQARLEPVT